MNLAWLLIPAFILGTALSQAWYAVPRSKVIPYWISPPVVIFGAPALAAAGFVVSGNASHPQLTEYFSLVGPSALGLSMGALVAGIIPSKVPRAGRRSSPVPWVWFLVGLGVAATAIHILRVGSPLAASNVEIARAGAGSGYLRVLGHSVLPAALIAFSYRTRRRRLIALTALIGIALFGNRSPLVYLLGALVVGSYLSDRAASNTSSGGSPQRSSTRLSRLTTATMAVVILSSVVLGGAVLRVVLTPDYRDYDEYAAPLREGDYVGIGLWSLRHYAFTVGQNAVLTKSLVDDDHLPQAYGASYLSGLLTAIPGEQLTLDRRIKDAAGADFIGGGIPPTLAGEGYVNFGFPGVFIGSFLVGFIHLRLARRVLKARSPMDPYIYGYSVVYVCLSQVAGIAGASPLPLIVFLGLLTARHFLPLSRLPRKPARTLGDELVEG